MSQILYNIWEKGLTQGIGCVILMTSTEGVNNMEVIKGAIGVDFVTANGHGTVQYRGEVQAEHINCMDMLYCEGRSIVNSDRATIIYGEG